jgi:DNA adenine methylase
MAQKAPVVQELRPPLKWPGGKRWLVPQLRPLWEPYRERRLVEPFCGALAVTLSLLPTEALLNDINPHLINFYRWIQRGLRPYPHMRNDSETYYRARERFNELIRSGQADTEEAAQLVYYLNRTGYNGLFRFNRRGEYNVPFGRYMEINYTQDFSVYQSVMARWEFRCGDFEEVELELGDFVYADPPYDVEFRQYSPNAFSWHDQVRLAKWLSRHTGPVVLSNQATERIIELYRQLGYTLVFLQAPRRISCTGDRSPAVEVLALRGIW